VIIIDFSQVYLAPIFLDAAAKSCAQNPSDESRDMMMHMVLNTIRAQQVMHKAKYGTEVVIAFDSPSWRKEAFQYYKWARKQKRETDTSGIDWAFVFETSTGIPRLLSVQHNCR
jgi:5'-3' exonuclease